jgi:spore maturation protein CgeB
MKIVIYGLTITSAWGNGHATTYRSLARALARLGHQLHFIEKDVEWYRANRDLPTPEFCSVHLYDDWKLAERSLIQHAVDADAIVVGSYFPDAIPATRALLEAGYGPILFYDIDTPITLTQLRDHGRCEYLEAALIPEYSAYLSFTGGPALRELEIVFGAQWAVPFYCSVDPDLYHPTPLREEFRCDLSYLGTYAKDRQTGLMHLLNGAAKILPQNNFLVAGAMYPAEELWASNVRRKTHVAPPDHPAFYSSSRFTLNLTRDDMKVAGYSPSVRLFEASACGTVILSDSWPGLDRFLAPGEEILLPADAAGTAEILSELSDEERERIGRRARERILTEHTAENRAREFELVVERCGAIDLPAQTEALRATPHTTPAFPA